MLKVLDRHICFSVPLSSFRRNHKYRSSDGAQRDSLPPLGYLRTQDSHNQDGSSAARAQRLRGRNSISSPRRAADSYSKRPPSKSRLCVYWSSPLATASVIYAATLAFTIAARRVDAARIALVERWVLFEVNRSRDDLRPVEPGQRVAEHLAVFEEGVLNLFISCVVGCFCRVHHRQRIAFCLPLSTI